MKNAITSSNIRLDFHQEAQLWACKEQQVEFAVIERFAWLCPSCLATFVQGS